MRFNIQRSLPIEDSSPSHLNEVAMTMDDGRSIMPAGKPPSINQKTYLIMKLKD